MIDVGSSSDEYARELKKGFVHDGVEEGCVAGDIGLDDGAAFRDEILESFRVLKRGRPWGCSTR